MKESKSNCIEIDIINENLVKINAKCNLKSIEERNYDSKESLFQISNNSLILSNTLSSLNTIGVSKNSLGGSIWIGGAEAQNRETPRKLEKKSPGGTKASSNFLINDEKKVESSENHNQKKYQHLKIEISKINNFFDKAIKTEEDDIIDDKNNENLCSQSVIYMSKNDDANKMEISNKSIFFTPSTICNYYQQSYLENSPNQETSKILKAKNLDDLNDDIIPKAINMDYITSKFTPPQIKYTKEQLQSCEKNEKHQNNNSNNMHKFKDQIIPTLKNKINFESETNNFTINTINFDEKKDKNEKAESKKEFQSFHELVNEIKKELVLNISAIDEDVSVSNNNIANVDQEEEKSKNSSQNFFVKNLGLNFCEMKLNKENTSSSINEIQKIPKLESPKSSLDQVMTKNESTNYSRVRKNCLSCISEISLNIKPSAIKNEDRVVNEITGKNLSSSNLIIQRPDNISISLDEKKIPIQNKISSTTKQKYISSLTKPRNGTSTSRPENSILNSYNKHLNSSRVNSSKKETTSLHMTENKTPDILTKRKGSKQKNMSTYDIGSNSKNKVLKSIIMNLVGNLIETGKNNKENISNKKKDRSIGKSLVSPSNVQTTSGTQSSNHKNNTIGSILDSDRILTKPTSNYNSGIVNNKKKEYLELIKLLSSNNDSHNRNKKAQDHKTHSKGKTFEITLDMDHNDRRNQSGKKTSANNSCLNNSKSNSITKSTNSAVKKTSNVKNILPLEMNKLQTSRLENRNTRKNLAVPINNYPQTSKNIKKNIVSDLVSQQKKNNLVKKSSDKVFISLKNQTPINNIGKDRILTELTMDGSVKKVESCSTKANSNMNYANLDRKGESFKNVENNSSMFKSETPTINIHKQKSDFVKIINNFSNYTKIKKDPNRGKENVNITNDSSYENKKQVTALQIRNSGGDEDSVFVDDN